MFLMYHSVYNISVPDVMQYLFWSGAAAAAAAATASRSVHEVAESVEADSRTTHRVPLSYHANVNRQ